MTNVSADKKGAFEKFRCDWLLQVAADPDAKSAMPVAVVLACSNLNRQNGLAWPSVNFLAEATGVKSHNTIRAALKMLEARGHAKVKWTKGGRKSTHLVMPIINGKPFKNLKGFEDANPSSSEAETPQILKQKPFKKLKGNLLKEPLDKPLEGSGGPKPTAAYQVSNEILDKIAPSHASNDASGARQEFSSGQRLSIKGIGRCVIMDVGIKRDTQATFIRVRLDRDASLALIPVNSEGVLVQGLLRMEADLPEKTMRQFEWEKRDAA